MTLKRINMPFLHIMDLRREGMIAPVGGFEPHRAIGTPTPYAYAAAGSRPAGVLSHQALEGEGFSLVREGLVVMEVDTAAAGPLEQESPVAVGADGMAKLWEAGEVEIGRCQSAQEIHNGKTGVSVMLQLDRP